MLSISRRFLFIHIPKTGGNSVQNLLRAYSEDQIVCLNPLQDGIERFEVANSRYPYHKHSTLNEYRSMLDPALFTGLYKFACVRNPWDRAVSFFFSPHRQVTHWNRDEFIRFLDDVPPMLSYLDAAGAGVAGAERAVGLDFLMRFERLREDFDQACDRLDIPRQELPHRNKSSRQHYTAYYDPALVDLVATRFEADIESFRYRFGEP